MCIRGNRLCVLTIVLGERGLDFVKHGEQMLDFIVGRSTLCRIELDCVYPLNFIPGPSMSRTRFMNLHPHMSHSTASRELLSRSEINMIAK